jgi:type IV secretory pathway VirB10-like protein
MTRFHLLSTAAVALALGVAALNPACAQTRPNPEPAPAAQQNAPPDKIAPPINAGEYKPPLPEVTGKAVKPPEPGHVKADENSNAELKAKDSGKGSTTGQGAAAGSAKLSSDQRSRISVAIKKQNVKSEQANFSVSVGTRVPPTVHYYPLPTEVVTIYPDWRGYDYILIGNQIVVIDPDTREIIAILES